MTPWWATLIVLVLLGVAAWRDFATRTIPDIISIAIAVLGIAVRAESGGWIALGWSVLVAAALFLVLVPLQGLGIVGGADLKLFAALALGLSPLASYQVVSASVLCGGVLAILYLSAHWLLRRRARPPLLGHQARPLQRLLAVELWRIRRRAALPYGIAIAAGAAAVFLHPPGV